MQEFDLNFKSLQCRDSIHSMTGFFQTVWLFSGAPEDLEDDTGMKKHSVLALYSTVKSLMQAIRADNQDAQHDATHRTILIGKARLIRRCS